MNSGDSWTCPHCNQPTTITTPNIDSICHFVGIDDARIKGGSEIGYRGTVIACPNISCKELSFSLQLKNSYMQYGRKYECEDVLKSWQLLPDSKAKPQPSYIPKQITQDYTEACRIKDLSPKASATLARRCLQGMIRDFWNINVKSGKLSDEITELEDKLTQNEWDAIDAVRSVGNIGAHMEKDVNLIIDVEPEEAELLIQLIEDMFQDWYVVRHDREVRQKKLVALAKAKQEARKKK